LKRFAYGDLLNWKKKKNRKPLLVQGARQVGKTYLIKEFGTHEYDEIVYFNFEETPDLISLFQSTLSPQKLIEDLSAFNGKRIIPETMLIFFDEIQLCQRALSSLKYFCEEASEYHIIGAGSLLGVSVGKSSSFPVGKVEFLSLYPMNFFEYLSAMNNDILVEQLHSKRNFDSLPEAIHNKLIDSLRYYLYIGGMPEVVECYRLNQDIEEVRTLQNNILRAYENDFSKYTSTYEAIRVSEVWQAIPSQLVLENKKFRFSQIRKGARSSTFESAIEWLRKAGLIQVVTNLTRAKLPLRAYTDNSKFKAYLLDNGLLGALVDISSKTIVTGDAILSEYNGAFIENFVATELISSGIEHLYYWRSENIAEVDFVLQDSETIIPLEVKSGLSRRMKGLRIFAEKFKAAKIYRSSPRNFTFDNDFGNIPLYGVSQILNLCTET